MKNEKTSKRIASDASYVMHCADSVEAGLSMAQREISKAIVAIRKAKAVAASALTQSPDREKK